MENNSLNLLRDAMRVDFENRVNLVRPNLEDFNVSLIFIFLHISRSYWEEWKNAGGSRGDFDECLEDLVNDIPNVLL